MDTIPFTIKGDVVGYTAVEIRPTGVNFYGPKGFFSPAMVTKSFAYEEMADIELVENRFGADNVTIHFKDGSKLPFIFQVYQDAGKRIVAAVKAVLPG